MLLVLSIALGGALGAVLRYTVVSWSASVLGTTFPFGTLMVNVVGSLLIGIIFVLFQGKFPHQELLRSAIIIGVLGGFTTFSAFSLETLNLIHAGQVLKALLSVVLNLGLCLFVAAVGMFITRQMIN